MSISDPAKEFLGLLKNRQGVVARPNGTFFSLNVVTTALQRIRLDLLNGASLTDKGCWFVAGAAAYLACLTHANWRKRGLQVSVNVNSEQHRLLLNASRIRDGEQELYSQDVLRDAHQLLLLAPEWFPFIHGRVYAMNSLVYPSPEYLYLYGVFLLQSPRCEGNWPRGQTVGGIEEDFHASRSLLVDDLHRDIGLPIDDQELRALSWWVVFPPYGWDMNDGQEYNMMTLVDQLTRKKTVSLDVGVSYLRSLMKSQLVFLRNLAARTLLVLNQSPTNMLETLACIQALSANDHKEASCHMARFRWILEGNDPEAVVSPEWIGQCTSRWQSMVASGPREAWRDAAILRDPEYLALAQLPPDRHEMILAALELLLEKHPNDWFLRSAYGFQCMKESEPARGEEMLRGCLEDAPDCPDAHFNLGTCLKQQGRREEAMSVFEAAVKRWPYHHQAVDSCMWLLTDDMATPRQ